MSNNQKRAFEDGDDAASKSPRHTNPSGNEIDIKALAETWSPESARLNRLEHKVTSLEDSNLRGGNFVLDLEGRATTLSFAFEKDGALYGLTAGHLADIGDPIFVFLLSSKTPNDFKDQDDDDRGLTLGKKNDKESYEVMEVGEVVSKDVDTDSLIFEITHPYMQGKVDLLQLLPGSVLADRALRLPDPNAGPAAPPAVGTGTEVIVYGAMRRGETGSVEYPSKDVAGLVSKKGDIGISSAGDGARPLTSGGDCGAIYMTRNGLGLAMHHCLRGEEAPYVSFGIPLASIFAKHSLLGARNVDANAVESQQRMAFPKDKHHESRNIARFDTKITKAVPPIGGMPIDEADVFESRDIAQFDNVRIVKKPGTGK